MAVLLSEPGSDVVAGAIGAAHTLHMSATNVAEALVVAARLGEWARRCRG